jgi:hypothetical protein
MAPSTTIGPCGSGQLQCKNKNKCYSFKEQCDFIDACGDNSDEALCGNYSVYIFIYQKP